MNVLTEWGERWNRKTKTVYSPDDEELAPPDLELGFPAVDMMLGGGIPRGRTTIIVGEPMSGKSLTAQLIIAASQRQGGTAIYIDSEHVFDEKWFSLTGVDTSPEKLLVVRPQSLEQAFDLIVDALTNVVPDVIVVDSIPALMPATVMETTMEEKDVIGVHARKLTMGIMKATSLNKRTALILINQLRSQIGGYGNPESMPGGRAIRHAASIILRTRKGKWLTVAGEAVDSPFKALDDEENTDNKSIGFILRLRTEKNKCAVPFQECDIKFKFTGEFDALGALITLAAKRGIIEQSRGFYTLPDIEKKIHGLNAVERFLREDIEYRDRLIQSVKELE